MPENGQAKGRAKQEKNEGEGVFEKVLNALDIYRAMWRMRSAKRKALAECLIDLKAISIIWREPLSQDEDELRIMLQNENKKDQKDAAEIERLSKMIAERNAANGIRLKTEKTAAELAEYLMLLDRWFLESPTQFFQGR